jgi:hypothetical protein
MARSCPTERGVPLITDKKGFDVDEQPVEAASVEGVKCEEEFLAYGQERGVCQLPKKHEGSHDNTIQPTPSQGSGERELSAAWPHEIPKDREWANVKAYGEFGNDRFLVDVLTELHIRERQLKAALAEIQKLKEVQPSVQFETWNSRHPVHSAEPSDIEWATFHRRLAWQAALAAKSGGGK